MVSLGSVLVAQSAVVNLTRPPPVNPPVRPLISWLWSGQYRVDGEICQVNAFYLYLF